MNWINTAVKSHCDHQDSLPGISIQILTVTAFINESLQETNHY